VIPIKPKPEPSDFAKLVRKPGNSFLSITPHPTAQEWEKRDYWRKALPAMSVSYKRICAYCAHWIPHSTGTHSIDHFIPKSIKPSLAYEWTNFRYVSSRFNSRKGVKTILDPFELQEGWVTLDLASFLLKPNRDLLSEQKQQVSDTIEILKLNSDDKLVQERQGWIEDFLSGQYTFAFLSEKAPFIASELLRQGYLQ